MFDIISVENDIAVRGIKIKIEDGTNIKLDIWTLPETYDSAYSDPLMWTLVTSTPLFSLNQNTLLEVPLPTEIEIQAGSIQAFYIHVTTESEKGLIVGSLFSDPMITDDTVSIRSSSRVFVSDDPFRISYPNYSL